MDATKPYEFIGFGATHVTKPCKFYMVWQNRRHGLPLLHGANKVHAGVLRADMLAAARWVAIHAQRSQNSDF